VSETQTALALPAAAGSGGSEPGTALAPAAGGALRGAQKAMLFLVSLDEEVATRVIANLSENEVTELRKATEALREIPAEALVGVHKEFLVRVRSGLPANLQGSGAYLRRLVGNALGEGKAAEIWADRNALPTGTPLAQLATSTLAALLDEEHPQTVAIVLSQLDAARAADVLVRTHPDRRADILERLGRLEDVPEAVLEEIEKEFAGHLARLGTERRRKVEGKDAAAGVLKRLKSDEARNLIDRIAEASPDIASTLEQSLFTFEDLLRVDGRGIQQLLKEVATDQLVLALKTASEELKEKVFGNLSSRAADMLREDISLLGPVRVADVEQAQRAIVESALALEREGRLTIAREGGADYV